MNIQSLKKKEYEAVTQKTAILTFNIFTQIGNLAILSVVN